MRSARTQRIATVAALLLATLAAGGSLGVAQSHDELFLDGLRERGLFELAEKYCADRLAETQLTDDRRATLSIELSRTCAEHAAQAAPDERAELWRRARRVPEEFATRNPRDPRLPLVRMQRALATLAEGELVREDAELAGGAADRFDAPRDTLRAAIVELRKLDDAIAAELRERGRPARKGGEGQLSVAELSSLDLHVRYQLARGLRNQGLCYPAASADRINSLGQAVELLAALSAHEMTPQLAWTVRLDEIVCLRLLGNFNEAAHKLADAVRAKPPPSFAPRLRAERIRLALAQGHVDEALSEAGPVGVERGAGWADANLAQLEAYLAGWHSALGQRDATAARRWEKASVDQARAIGQMHSPAAARRAETLLARSIADAPGPKSPQAMLLAAQSLYRAGRLDEALAAYDLAAQRAVATADKNSNFDSRYAAGALEHERHNYRAALARLGTLANEMPQHARAAEAHLLAIHSAAQVAAEHDPPQLDEYERLLRKHVENWSTGPTASQAWWWLGRLAEHKGAWQEAIRAFKNVKPDYPQYDQAVAALGNAYEAALDELRSRGNRNALFAQDAVDDLERVFARGGKPVAPTDATRAAVLAAARIALKDVPSGAGKARQMLTTALENDAAAPREWQRQARLLLVPALAADGQPDKAEALLAQLPIGTASEVVATVELLTAVKERVASDDRRAVARIEATLIGDALAKQGDLDAATVKTLVRHRAETLVELGQREEAKAALSGLAKKYPRDGQVQEDFAVLLTSGTDRVSRQAAVTKWRDVAQHCRPGSDRWFRAHLALARLQLELGQPAEARATIKMVEAAQPEFGGAEMKARFQQLLAECNRASARDPQAKE